MKNFLIILLPFFVACTPGGGSNNQSAPVKPQFLGDLASKASEIYEDDSYLYYCDTSAKAKVLEVTNAIEANRRNIQDLRAQNISQRQDLKEVRLNGYSFLEKLTNIEQTDEWRSDRYSWNDVYNRYQMVKNNPLSEEWISINADARSLIVEDENRILYQLHPGMRRSQQEMIYQLYNRVLTCFQNPSCTSFYAAPNELSWLQEGRYHSYILSQMNSGDSFSDKRKRIEWLTQDLKRAARSYGFVINPTLKVYDNTLWVPLNLQILGSDADMLLKRLEQKWSIEGLKLKVYNSTEGYKVKIDSTPGERAYVNHEHKLIQIYSPTPFATIEHEFGHVLGLKDQYYTWFDQSKCEYVDEYNMGNIMSSGTKVLPEHTLKILQGYGINLNRNILQ